MARKKLRHGVGAVCEVLLKYLHSRPIVAAKYPNATARQRLGGLLCIRKEMKKVNHKQVMCFVFRHNEFEGHELHCMDRWAKVTAEGDPDHFFTEDTLEEAPNEQAGATSVEVPALEGLAYDVLRLRAEGYDVDDDNDPAPKNTPAAAASGGPNAIYGQWGFSGICQRRVEHLGTEGARLRPVTSEIVMSGLDVLTMFLMFLPKAYFETVLLPETNKNIDGGPLNFGEFLQFLGLWLYMSTTAGFTRLDWFSQKPVDLWQGAPFRFNHIMSGNRFDAIISALTFTATPPPPFTDKFHEVRDLIQAWNCNMAETFSPSWVSCLDESMSKWTSKWTCPGFMFVPRKPWPMGNEYHSICCALSGVMYWIELVEGKDAPPERGSPAFSHHGKTVGLMLRMCQSIFHSGKLVVLDSGFCVLKGIIELKKMGVFASALIKKRRYWPKDVNGEAIAAYFEDKDVGHSDAWPGEQDGVRFHLFCMKEPDYVMSLMSTYGTTSAKAEQPETKRHYKNAHGADVSTTFRYPEVVGNHYSYRGCVDDHNNKRQDGGSKQGLAIETTWVTRRWPIRVFSFILGISEVNAFLGWSYFKGEKLEFMAFRKLLARALIYNRFVDTGAAVAVNRGRKRRMVDHTLVKAPLYAKRWTGGEWDVSAKNKYQQYVCSTRGCKAQVRTFCKCSPGTWMCAACLLDHVVDGVTIDSPSH